MPRTPSVGTTIGIAAVTSLVVFSLAQLSLFVVRANLFRSMQGRTAWNATSTFESASSQLSTEDDAVTQLVKRAEPAVVAVLVTSDVPQDQTAFDSTLGGMFDPLYPNSPAPVAPKPKSGKQPFIEVGGGSGFFVSADGVLVTNKHVVEFKDARYEVVTNDGAKYPATLLAKDPQLDIAFLKVSSTSAVFATLSFADSSTLKAGQTVVAIGNALDEFRNTVTKGIISGLNRHILAGDGDSAEQIEEAIQTDAAINPGNSGGPLLNLHGQVVGLNTAVAEQAQLLGFALPANIVSRDAVSLQKTGKISRPFLGVRYELINADVQQQEHLSVDQGALVISGSNKKDMAVSPDSPAAKAGIVENDIILQVDGDKITEDQSLAVLVGRHVPGDQVVLKVMHASSTKDIPITLVELKTP